MRNGVVIGCVGVVAAATIAIVVYTQPPAATSDLAANPATVQKPGPTRFTRAATPVAKPAAHPIKAAEVAPARNGPLPAAYRILMTRSIFCPNGTAATGAAKSSEPTLTLRGVVQWRRGFVAFIENSASGESRMVRVGDTIGQKKVINIDFHSVEFVEGKRAMKVAVGQTLGGIASTGNGSALATVRPQLD